MANKLRLLAVLAGVSASMQALAVENIALSIGRVDAGTWSTGELKLELAFPASDRVSARLHSEGLALPGPFQSISHASVECPQAAIEAEGLRCADAALRLGGRDGSAANLPLSVNLDQSNGDWRLRLSAEDLQAGAIWAFAAGNGLVPAMEVSAGRLTTSLLLSDEASVPTAVVDVALTGARFSDAAGLHAGEDLSARVQWQLMDHGQLWRTHASLLIDAGQLFLDPVYLDAGATPLTVSARGEIRPGSGALRVSEFQFHHRSVADMGGTLTIGGDGALQMLDMRLSRASLAALYRVYLQPFAIGTLFDALEISGDVDAQLHWQPSAADQRVQLNVYDAGIEDKGGRFRLFGLGGHLDWSAGEDTRPTALAWQGGQIYRIDYGPGSLAGRLAGRRFRLEAPVRVPMLEGEVRIDALQAAAIGTPDLNWNFRGGVRPMSLQALTRALGWPPFGGSLAGNIPLVSYAGGTIAVDGSLDVAVFDGNLRIRKLGIADPFGIIPVLRADVDVENLSLDALTSTFSFGKIQGRLQGRVHGLILKDWKPTGFDARFATPENDDSRHRISQRAVENLASLGGTGAVLSSTFLRLFEEFSYRRLGISCRLSRGVCEMDGVAPAEKGYYIVEGGGLPPRIDVLGFNRRVDWPVLLGRLKQINSAEGPVVR
jgi:hypothetical protein